MNRDILQGVVKPIDHQYEACSALFTFESWDRLWDELDASSSLYEDKTLSKEGLCDDYQLLLVSMILDPCSDNIPLLSERPDGRRKAFTHTAGTGKTRTVQTTLQDICQLLSKSVIPDEFVRCAAPTECAAWNLKCNATTKHRLVRWTNLRYFDDMRSGDWLSDFH